MVGKQRKSGSKHSPKYKTINGFDVFNYVFLGLLSLIFIIPFWTTINTSLVSNAERLRRGMFIFYPEVLDFNAYRLVLKRNSPVFNGYMVTLFRAIVGTASNMIVTATLAYGLAKRDLPLRSLFSFFIYFTMLFSGGLVPTFLVVKYTGMYNNMGALIVPGLVSVWNVLLMRNFFMQIPESLEEAAIIDGASPPSIFVRIVLPLSVPSLVTIGMFYAVAHWNSWFDALIYIRRTDLRPLQLVLRDIIISSDIGTELTHRIDKMPPTDALKAAAIIVTTLPILFVYPFAQKYFVKGILIGGVKG